MMATELLVYLENIIEHHGDMDVILSETIHSGDLSSVFVRDGMQKVIVLSCADRTDVNG